MRRDEHKVVTVRLPTNLYDAVKANSQEQYRTLNGTIALALQQFLEGESKEKTA